MLRSQLTVAIIATLRAAWPVPVDLLPSALVTPHRDVDEAFLDAIHGLVDEGLVMVEALLLGTSDEPVARQAVLTRKGATILYQVMQPI